MAEYDKQSLREGCRKLLTELDDQAIGNIAVGQLKKYLLLVNINIEDKFI